MTKEELIKNSTWVDETRCSMIYMSDFKMFLESNVCIPKGETRHPYADEWHQVLEGAKFQSYNQTKEPEYEWQILVTREDKDNMTSSTTIYSGEYFTDNEMLIKATSMAGFESYQRIEETKRVRQ